jgi:hypothetical protein
MTIKTEGRYRRFHAAVTTLATEYEKEISGQRIKIWWVELERYPIDFIEQAFKTLLRTNRFFPKLSEVIEILDGSAQDKAILAWRQVYDAVRNGESDRGTSLQFIDKAIQPAVRMIGGWQRLRKMREDEVPFRQREFVAAYAAAQKTAILDYEQIECSETRRGIKALCQGIGKDMP